MKNYRPLLIWIGLYLVLFIGSVWIGRWAGHQTRTALAFGDHSTRQNQPGNQEEIKRYRQPSFQPKSLALQITETAPDLPSPQIIPDRQRNILVIGVDDMLSAEPQLQSLWMVLFLNNVPHLMMVPIYPAPVLGSANSQIMDEDLASLFRLDDEMTPAAEFITSLEDQELWWTGYIILDQQALRQILAVIVGSSPSAESFANDMLASAQGDALLPEAALSSQTRFVQEMCRLSSWFSTADPEQILDMVANIFPHIRTNLDLEVAVSEIKNAVHLGGGISCEFPTVIASTNGP
ncbi:MAG: hypothetical protein A2W33_10565 [Chloroflexi bacterium RBG_16_52_11]|nr:MAG: hypothetical protein A2W33_10565 [Chloroflexi bacterium RBG_16_52_11]